MMYFIDLVSKPATMKDLTELIELVFTRDEINNFKALKNRQELLNS